MGVVIKNNAASFLAADILDTDLTFDVQDAAAFPALGVDEYMYLTLQDANNPSIFEIVKVTDTTGVTFTIERAQQGTNATAFSQDDLVELRLTVATLDERYINSDEITNADSIDDTDSINKFGKIPLLVNDSVIVGGEFVLNMSHNLCDIKVTSSTQDVVIKLPSDSANSQFACQVFNNTQTNKNVTVSKPDGTVVVEVRPDDAHEIFINKDATPAINAWTTIRTKGNSIPELDVSIFGDFDSAAYETLFVDRFVLKGNISAFSNTPPNFPVSLGASTVLCTIINNSNLYEQRVQVDNHNYHGDSYRGTVFFRIVSDFSLLADAPWVSFALNSRVDYLSQVVDTKVNKTTQIMAGAGMVGGGDLNGDVTLNHEPTSTETSESNTGTTVIQSVEIDSFGHVTGLSSVALDLSSFSGTAGDSAQLGGVPASDYLRLSSNQTVIGSKIFDTNVRFNDSRYLEFGSDGDYRIFSDGTDLVLQQMPSVSGQELFIRDSAGNTQATYDWGNKYLGFVDNFRLVLGTDSDFSMFHSPSGSYLDANTADLHIRALEIGRNVTVAVKTSGGNSQTVLETVSGASTSFAARYNNQVVFDTIGSGVRIGGTNAITIRKKGGTDSEIFSSLGTFDLFNNAHNQDLRLGVRNADASYDYPLVINAGASDGLAYPMLKYGDADRLQTTVNGIQVTGQISDDSGVPFTKNKYFNNTSVVTVKGSGSAEGASVNTIDKWSGTLVATLDEATFKVGDMVIVARLYETVGDIEIITDEGAIYYNGNEVSVVHAGGKSVTMNSGKFIAVFRKVDLVNWVLSFLPV